MSHGRRIAYIFISLVLLALILIPWSSTVFLFNIHVKRAWNGPQWSVAPLSQADLDAYPIPVADTCLAKVSGLRLMQTTGINSKLPNTHMTVLGWSDGSMHVIVSRGFVMPLDDKGIPQPYRDMMPVATQVYVSNGFTMVGLVPGIEGMQCGVAVRTHHDMPIVSPRHGWLVGVRTLVIGKMNQGTWPEIPKAATPSPDPLKEFFNKPCKSSDCKFF
jgi:hypothetical protein